MPSLLQASSVPRETRTAYWNEVVAANVVGMDLRFDEAPDERDQIMEGDIGPVHVVESRSGPGEARRTDRHIRRNDPQRYALFMQVDGSSLSEQGGRCSRFEPGDVGLVNLSQPMRCRYTERRAVLASFPKALSPLREEELWQLRGLRISGSEGAGALLSSLIRQLPHHLDTDDGANGTRLATAVLDLVNIGFAARLDRTPAVPTETRTRALLLQCRGFIEQHLDDPDLTPHTIAAAHHISTRYLHRLFEPTGDAVAALIRRRRLDRCRRDLLDPDLAARPVSAIGARWGLTEAAHFNRLFKSAFGMPPAEFRATHSPKCTG
jgi:AraC-like DNA-binding protein